MATITKGYIFGSSELVTNTKLHTLVDSATISGITGADVSSSLMSLNYTYFSSQASLYGGLFRAGTIPESVLDITSSPVTNYVMRYDGSKMDWVGQHSLVSVASSSTKSIQYIIDGGGDVFSTGARGDIEVPFACTIQQVTMLANATGMAQVDIWKDTYANFPPTSADSISLTKPAFNNTFSYQNTSLISWNVSLAAGSILRYNVESLLSISRLGIFLKVST